ncbi:MAG: Gfo/Idh/MocA family protein [Pirellulaceae bacterium]
MQVEIPICLSNKRDKQESSGSEQVSQTAQNHRAAVVGTGFIGPVHVEGLRRAGIPIVGILGSRPERSQEAAEQLGIDKAYNNLDELLADPNVTSVHITSPNIAHFEQASACLKAGKHVLCEKPLAMNSAETLQLVELAAASGLAAGVNYNIRYYPLCIEAAERRKSGTLGDVRHISGSYVQDWLFHASDFNWRVLSEQGGALRAIADIGTHWLDLIHAVTGLEVESVCADLQTVFEQRFCPRGSVETFTDSSGSPDTATDSVEIDTEDYGAVLIRFRGGARGVMHVSQVTAGRKNCLRFEVAGSKQTVAWNSESPNELWVGQRDELNQSLVRNPALMSSRAAEFANYPAGHNEGFPDTFKQLFVDFYRNIDTGSFASSPTFPTFADGHREVVLCEAILASAEQRCWVELPS